MKKLMMILPILCGLLWGAAGIFVRRLNDFGMDRVTLLSSKMSLAAVVLFIGILLYDKSLLKIKLKDIWILLSCGLLGVLGLNFCYNEAVSLLNLSLAAVLLSLSPVFVVLIAGILFREKITPKKVRCMLLALLGCTLASGILEDSAGIKSSAAGIMIGIAAAFFYALYSIFSRLAMVRGYKSFTITFYSLLTVSLVILPFTNWGMIGGFIQAAPAANCSFMLLHSVGTSVLPYVLYTVALQYIETGKASILAAGGEPAAAVIFGVLFFAEIPTAITLLGLAITIAALALLCSESNPG